MGLPGQHSREPGDNQRITRRPRLQRHHIRAHPVSGTIGQNSHRAGSFARLTQRNRQALVSRSRNRLFPIGPCRSLGLGEGLQQDPTSLKNLVTSDPEVTADVLPASLHVGDAAAAITR